MKKVIVAIVLSVLFVYSCEKDDVGVENTEKQ